MSDQQRTTRIHSRNLSAPGIVRVYQKTQDQPNAKVKPGRRAGDERNELAAVAVGTPVTGRPPRRSVQAAFPHTACMELSLSPSGTSPVVARRHSAISSLRASATIIVVLRAPLGPSGAIPPRQRAVFLEH
jgi:hypothetical protein